ncbi:MAG: acyltransferase [Gemmobacter sp.]|nr:acyltransferase [Gemmobacter sp.]
MTVERTDHRQALDLIRILAAFGIVWAHMGAPWPQEGYTAISVFLIMTAHLSVESLQRSRGRFSWLGRASRIIIPWVLWSLFFKALIVLTADDKRAALGVTDPWSLLVGPSIHLWFLPFLMLGALLVVLANRTIHTRREVIALSVLAIPLSVEVLMLHRYGNLPEPIMQWAFALPPFLYGMLAAYARGHGVMWAPLGFITIVAMISYAITGESWGPQFIVGALIFEWARQSDLRNPALPVLGKLAFGIYLIHPFFLLVWYFLMPAGSNTVIASVFVFVASGTTIALLRQAPLLGRLL